MTINQLSVFIENKRGRLAEITNVLKQNNVDIRALSIADTKEFGILRLIVSDAGKAAEVLRADGFTVALTQVVAIEMCIRDRFRAGQAGCSERYHAEGAVCSAEKTDFFAFKGITA